MPSQDAILLYGRDKQLLEIRQLLLQGSGYRVWVATSLEQIDALSHTETIDLLLLCHLLTLEQSGRALAFSQSRWPLMESLFLSVANPWGEAGNQERVFETSQGPAKLLATLGQLLDHQSTPHSHLY
jgi:hypothetical protein